MTQLTPVELKEQEMFPEGVANAVSCWAFTGAG